MAMVRVLALGNVLVGDDGAGPYAMRFLETRYEFPEGVELEEIGTPGFDLLPLLEGVDHVVFLDTVRTGEPPGTVRVIPREELVAAPLQPRTSPHDPGLRDALLEAEFRGFLPAEVLLIGVVPERVEAGTALSATVMAAIPELAERVAAELGRMGFPPALRAEPLPLEVWWEERETRA